MQAFLSHPVTQGIIIALLSALIIGLMGGFIQWLKSQFMHIIRRVEMLRIEMRATDSALEQSIGNGYTKTRATRMNQLIQESKFVNSDDFN